MRYVRYCENMADMHWKLKLWATDEGRDDDAQWHGWMYAAWTNNAFLEESPEWTEPEPIDVDAWKAGQGVLVLEDRTPHEMTEYHHR